MQTMVIDAPTAQRFIAAYKDFLGSLVSAKDKAGKTVLAQLAAGRERYCADRTLLAAYRAAHPNADAQMLDAIAQSQMGNWVHLKDTRAYSVVLDVDATRAYAVLGLTQPLRTIGLKGDKVMGSGLVIQAALVPLGGRWVCDGLIQNPVWLGPNYRRSYTASYTALRKGGQFSVGPEAS
jgi:hypothetical protein